MPGGRSAGDQHLEQCLLGMPAVLGLIPDALSRSVEDLVGDLVARMGRQAVQRDRPRRGERKQLVVDPVVGQPHTSVYTASAPATAERGSSVSTTPGSGSS